MSAESLKKFAAALREIPKVAAIKVATAVAPVLTTRGRETFDAGEDAYGVPWVPKEDGTPATLVDTGALARGLVYVSTGTKLRVRLPVAYAKYQLGKRPAFPRQGDALPASFAKALSETAAEVISEEVANAS